jgi:tripartite-type tricarboxylate transporter receptor subunit TctC
MKLPHRQFLHIAAGAAALPAVSRIARAQAYPTRPVRIVVGLAAGSSLDILARLMGQWLSERLGQPFVIENRPGAGTNAATEAVVRSAPDGYTLLAVSPANAINATLYEKLNFNFIGDIAPVASSNSTASHMAGELFKMMAGVAMVHVPYRGGGPALTDLIGGQVQAMFPGTIASVEYIKTGKLRALAVTLRLVWRRYRLTDRRRFRARLRIESDGWRRRA